MEENELEEGEAFFYKEEAKTSVDPEIALSYIGEKLQDILGHFQKDFEGGVSAEKLGPKFGGYGSFLPTYQHSPSIRSHSKTPHTVQNCSKAISPKNLSMEGCPQILKVPSDAHPSVKLGTTCDVHSSHISRVPSRDVSAKQDPFLPVAPVMEMSPSKHETSNKSVNSTGHRLPKVQIRVGSVNAEKKNAEIYSGLGLDNSPSSFLGNSPDESGGMPLESQETLQESPISILQIMTSFVLPEGVLLSPLHDSFVCLIRKKQFPRNNKHVPTLEGSQEHYALSSDKGTASLADRKVLNEKKTRLVGKSEWKAEVKHRMFVDFKNDMLFPSKEEVENQNLEDKENISSDLKFRSLSNTLHRVGDGDSGSGAGRPTENFRVVNKDGMKERISFSDLDKEECLKTITGQDDGKRVQRNVESSYLENTWECGVSCSNKDVTTDPREDSKHNGNKLSAQIGADSDMFRVKEDTNAGEMDSSQRKVGQKAASHDRGRITISSKKEKQLWEGTKKSMRDQTNGEPTPHLAKEGLRTGLCSAPKDKYNLKPQKDIGEVKDNPRGLLTNRKSEQRNEEIDSLERPKERAKVFDFEDAEKGGSALFKSKGISSGKKAVNQNTSDASIQVALDTRFIDNKLITMVPATVTPVVIEENWVCCDSCQKWRLLPFGKKPEDLPEKWLCSMLSWLPGLNRCDISEEETTKALNALHQLPIPENLTNMHNHINRSTSGVTLADVKLPGRNHQIPSSHQMLNQGKNEYGCMKLPNAGYDSDQIANTGKNPRQEEPLKSRRFISLHDLDFEKHSHKQSEKHMKKGDLEQAKTKHKREADKHGGEASKKAKTEDVSCSAKSFNFKHSRDVGKVCVISDPAFPAKGIEKEVIKSKDICCLIDSNYDEKDRILISPKSLEDEAQTDIVQTTKHHIQENKAFKEQNSEAELRKEKKTKLLIEEVESSTSKGDDRLRKGVVTRILLSGSKDDEVDNIEETRNIEKDQQHKRREEKVMSQQTLDYVDSMKKDLGTGKIPMIDTSSSSKVSGSCKTKANVQEVKGSPAASVSSSPVRTSKLHKCTAEKGSILRKYDAADGGLSMMVNPRKCLGGVGTSSCYHSEAAIKEKVSCVFPPKSLELRVPDYQDGDAISRFSSMAKPSEFGTRCMVKGNVVTSEQHYQYNSNLYSGEHCDKENRKNQSHFCGSALFPQKSVRGSSKEDNGSSRSDFDGDKKVCGPLHEQEDLHAGKSLRSKLDDHQHLAPYAERVSDVKHHFPDQDCIKHNNSEKNHVNQRNSLVKWSRDKRKENQLTFREDEGSNLKLGESCSLNGRATPQKIFTKSSAEKTEPKEFDSKGETLQLFPHHKGKHETFAQDSHLVPGSQKKVVSDLCSAGASIDADLSKVLKEPSNLNVMQQSLSHVLRNEHRVRDLSVSSPVRKHSSGPTAANTLQEAKDLKDYADRLKSSGFGFESDETYFQAAVKFLHGASLLETCNSDSGKMGVMTQIQAYSTAAKLCKRCAHEYERREEMAAAALAYKCMEVAYMRMVYWKHSSINKDQHELQATLQIASLGESPSSSASDIDNLNYQATTGKTALSKVPHAGGKHVITARNHPNFVRLLDFIQDVNFAIEASRKSQKALLAANSLLEEVQNQECVTSVRKVIDFSFQDVEGLIHLVRLAQEAISHSGLSGSRD